MAKNCSECKFKGWIESGYVGHNEWGRWCYKANLNVSENGFADCEIYEPIKNDKNIDTK